MRGPAAAPTGKRRLVTAHTRSGHSCRSTPSGADAAKQSLTGAFTIGCAGFEGAAPHLAENEVVKLSLWSRLRLAYSLPVQGG
jgi:hypothetical protein